MVACLFGGAIMFCDGGALIALERAPPLSGSAGSNLRPLKPDGAAPCSIVNQEGEMED